MSALVDTTTGEVVEQCDEHRARDLTDKIKTSLGVAWELVKDAYRERAWAALGYRSWDAYVTEEFSSHTLRLPREERQEVVSSLRQAGMSIRAIAAATGTGTRQVQEAIRETSGVVSDHTSPSSEPSVTTTTETRRETTVTGTDGKQYPAAPAKPAPKPQRRALPMVADDAGWGIRKAAEKLEALAGDDRLSANEEQVAAKLAGHLTYAIEVCQDLLDRLVTEPNGDAR